MSTGTATGTTAARAESTSDPDPTGDRPASRFEDRVDKFSERRRELARAAMDTLAALGYAKTSLREIAQNTEFSHGVLHYYFRGKSDLITSSVLEYKRMCIANYDRVTSDVEDADELATALADLLASSAQQDNAMHRLWYDLRNQSQFEPELTAVVEEIEQSLSSMIWRVVSAYAEMAGGAPLLDQAASYGFVDGLFSQAVFGVHAGRPESADALRESVTRLLPRLITP